MRRLFLILLFCMPAGAQVVQLTGGQSSLLDSAGAGATFYLPHSTAYVGAGCAYGHCGAGIADTFTVHGWDAIAGDSSFGFSVAGAGLSTQVRGLQLQRVRPQDTAAVFVGGAGLGYGAGFFTANSVQRFGAGLFYKRKARRWTFATLATLQHTAVQGVDFRSPTLRFAASGGLLNGARLINGQVDWQPVRALDIGASHITYFQPSKITSDSLSANFSLGHYAAQASVNQATGKDHSTTGEMLGAGAHFGPVSLQGNWYHTAGTQIFTQSAQEHIGRRLSLSQTVSQQGGRASYGAGGGYRSNSLSVSVEHSMAFTPRGWQQVTQLQVSLRLPHDSAVTIGTTVLPDGQTKYGVAGSTWGHGPLQVQANPRQHSRHAKAGQYVIAGRVVDKAGEPVGGAAVVLGKETVYSNPTGAFSMRVGKQDAVLVHVRPDDFVAPGAWVVVAAPDSARPGQPLQIVVSTN